MADSATPAPSQLPDRSRGFVLGFGAAQAGAYITFIPLLTLILPEKARLIGGEAGAALLLSQAAMFGGLTAAIANLAFGALSDRTHSRLGRRRPWIVGGLLGLPVSFALLTLADSAPSLILGVIVFQLAVNAFFAPLNALVPDLVPDRQKGLISAWSGAALPIANLVTATIVIRLHPHMGLQFAVVGVIAGLLILPFALRLREPAAAAPVFTLSFRALRDRTFALAFLSRLLAETAIAIHTLFLFLWISNARGAAPEDWSAVRLFSLLLAASTVSAVIAGFLGGAASDRAGRRLPFVVAGAGVMAAALATFSLSPPWPGMLIAQLLFGAAHGLHATTVAAMTAEILPDRFTFGRDLGVMNLAIALPQSFAPALAAVFFAAGLPLTAIFMVAMSAAALSGLVLFWAGLNRRPRP